MLFMSANICSPLSIPGPRNEWIDVRLALSNEALNMMSVPNLSFILTSSCATVSSNSADSITHGPAINLCCIFSIVFYFIWCKDTNYIGIINAINHF